MPDPIFKIIQLAKIISPLDLHNPKMRIDKNSV
jgi:hypothetical protein